MGDIIAKINIDMDMNVDDHDLLGNHGFPGIHEKLLEGNGCIHVMAM